MFSVCMCRCSCCCCCCCIVVVVVADVVRAVIVVVVVSLCSIVSKLVVAMSTLLLSVESGSFTRVLVIVASAIMSRKDILIIYKGYYAISLGPGLET